MTYTAAVLTKESRKRLLALTGVVFADIRADHVTLAWEPSADELVGFPAGKTVRFQAVGQVVQDGIQVVAVRGIKNTTGKPPHITMSLAKGKSAKDAGNILASSRVRLFKATPLEATLRVCP